MEIASANPADAPALRDLHLATWEVAFRGHAAQAWYRDGLAAHAIRDWAEVVRSQAARGGGVLAARSDGRIVGLCQYGPTEDEDHDPEQVGHIHRLFVHPRRQRAGIGRALLTASVDRLREAGMSTATLWVLESDRHARAFYEGLGWKPDGGRKADPPADVRYGLSLDPG